MSQKIFLKINQWDWFIISFIIDWSIYWIVAICQYSMVFNYNCIIYTLTVLVTRVTETTEFCKIFCSYYQTSKISETFSAKISTQKNFWELGSQDPILFPPLPSTYMYMTYCSALHFVFKQRVYWKEIREWLSMPWLWCVFMDKRLKTKPPADNNCNIDIKTTLTNWFYS